MRTKPIQMKKINLSKNIEELHHPIIFDSAKSAQDSLARLAEALKSENAVPVTLEVFSGDFAESGVKEFLETMGIPNLPVNWIKPLDETSLPVLAGAHITAIKGCTPKFAATKQENRSVFYSTPEADYCRTFGIIVKSEDSDGYKHTLDNLEEISAALEIFGFSYNDIARTWFYNDDILSWYAPFNKARTEFYSEHKIFEGLLPASTGIGAPNRAGKKITSGAIAMKPHSDSIKISELESPLQCGATDYGSSFSRAVEIETPHSRRIMISGTASIESGGKTAHEGDIKAQVKLTMDVIEAILRSRNMNFSDTVRSIVYCLRPEYYASFLEWQRSRGIDIPHCPSFSIVCRSDLLFEVELEAAVNL